MGLFSPKRTVGSMRLDFTVPQGEPGHSGSVTDVAVSDQIPDATPEVHLPLWFAFFYAGKLLFNFPGASGQGVIRRAIEALGKYVDEDHPLAYNGTMLGVCTGAPVRILKDHKPGQWVYSSELYYKGDALLVDTKIAHGHEDHFHRAAIDTAFEVVRLRLGERGGVVPTFALGYFAVLAKYDCTNLARNLQFAASAAMTAAGASGMMEASR